MLRPTIARAATTLAATLLATAAAAAPPKYSVRITNLTRGQVFTPVLAVSHGPGVLLFTPGQPASVELEILAEAGDTGPLEAMLQTSTAVADTAVSAAVPPGHTATLELAATGPASFVSLAAMLVPTNDGFVSLNRVPAPTGHETAMFLAYAWDAGTEPNTELCQDIPGPPMVCTGEGFDASRAGAVDFVHIHSGVHGVGDLAPNVHDWNNPVARVLVTRMPGGGPAGGVGPGGDDEHADDEGRDDRVP
jgi:hypothetical protein